MATIADGKPFAYDLPDLSALPKVDRAAEDALDAAQDLVYEAWETSALQKRLTLAKKALKKSPYCVDALNILANNEPDAETAHKIYQLGEEIGRKYLGEKFFKENAGIFWGLLETRPYMRAKHGLALSSEEMGDKEGAVRQYQEMLDLCENDNLGARYKLLPLLIETGQNEEAEKLYKKYEEDCSAVWLYGRLLLDFIKYGPGAEVDKSLAEAMECNKYAAKIFSLRKKMPKTLPWAYSPGSQEEAVYAGTCMLNAWKATPGAVEWLAAKTAPKPRKRKTESA